MEDPKDLKQWMEFARINYTGYGDRAEWKAFDGRPMPQWHELPDHIQQKWCAATAAVITTAALRVSEMLELVSALFNSPEVVARLKAELASKTKPADGE